MLNHHSITKLIISLTLTLLKCYYFNTLGVDYIYTGSVDLTLEVLLCRCKATQVNLYQKNKKKLPDYEIMRPLLVTLYALQ